VQLLNVSQMLVSFYSLGSVLAKAALRTLMKLPLGLYFINFLCKAFMHAEPKSEKKTVKLSIFFTLLGSAHAKAARRMLMKLTQGGG